MGWAGAVTAPANTIAAAAAHVMNVFMWCLSSRPLAWSSFSLASARAQVQIGFYHIAAQRAPLRDAGPGKVVPCATIRPRKGHTMREAGCTASEASSSCAALTSRQLLRRGPFHTECRAPSPQPTGPKSPLPRKALGRTF